MNKSVFYDPSGKRARRAGFLLGLALALMLAIFAAFAATLALAPHIPNISFRNPRVLTAAHENLRAKDRRREVPWTKIHRPRAHGTSVRPLNVAFYANWDDSAHQSLREHLKQIDVFSPQWVALTSARGGLEIGDDPTAELLFKTANFRPSVMPLVHNAHNELFDGKMADTMLADPAARRAVIANLVEQAKKRGFSGYVFDFENLSAKGLALYPAGTWGPAEADRLLEREGRGWRRP